jgi:circadian clock protein KaiC
MSSLSEAPAGPPLPKAPTGIGGLDQITRGGLPRGRCMLVTGAAGTGKTLLGIQFLAAGARGNAGRTP